MAEESKKYNTAELEIKIQAYKEKILEYSFSFGDRMSKGDMPSKAEIAERALYMKMHTDLVKILKETKKGKSSTKGADIIESMVGKNEFEMGIASVQQNTKE